MKGGPSGEMPASVWRYLGTYDAIGFIISQLSNPSYLHTMYALTFDRTYIYPSLYRVNSSCDKISISI